MKQYIVDAFASELFKGNQAAVCVMDKWIPEGLMQDIARENNFSETAFTVRQSDGSYEICWYTPAGEIDFCGHATLGTSFVLFKFFETDKKMITLHTKCKGDFHVEKTEDGIRMEFPSFGLNPVEVTDDMEKAFGARPAKAFLDRDLLCVFDDEAVIHDMKPLVQDLQKLKGLCVAVTAKGKGRYDCVSRVFTPDIGILEDPVTGSTHCMIAPFWAKELGKKEILAFQASERTGELLCKVDFDGKKVFVTGKAVLFAISEIYV